MDSTSLYPTSPKDALAKLYVGRSIRNVPTPAAIVNVAAARRNCERMLDACRSLGLGWRAHVKTHKTAELTKLQVGDDPKQPVNLIISTLIEAEFLLPLLKDYRSQGRAVNVLYGLPVSKGSLSRLAAIAKALGDDSISVLLDAPEQVPVLSQFRELSGVLPLAHIKVDMGGKRAGVVVESDRFQHVADAALTAHHEGSIKLAGLYSHAGHSYGGDSRVAAIEMMKAEINAMFQGATMVHSMASAKSIEKPVLTVSAGASPTALAVQNLLVGKQDSDDVVPKELQAASASLSALFADVRSHGHEVEIHAGVYPLLDLQQLAAHSLSSSLLSWGDIAMTVLAEVHSLYPIRGTDGTTEALVGAGGLALGREFCKAYDGMAMLSPWGRKGVSLPEGNVENYSGWMIGRFSQEHGIVTWGTGKASSETAKEASAKLDELEIGQLVRLWPNHACITSSHFGWYFVVDEDRAGKEDEIVDVWIKARGW